MYALTRVRVSEACVLHKWLVSVWGFTSMHVSVPLTRTVTWCDLKEVVEVSKGSAASIFWAEGCSTWATNRLLFCFWTAIQAGRSRVRSPLGPLRFFIGRTMTLDLASNKWVPGILLGGEGGRCVGLANFITFMCRLSRNSGRFHVLLFFFYRRVNVDLTDAYLDNHLKPLSRSCSENSEMFTLKGGCGGH